MSEITITDLGGVLQISAGGFGVFVVLDSDVLTRLEGIVDKYRIDAMLGTPEYGD
jgi:hypothetical protein